YSIPCATTDHREVLADPEVQAVVIATRDDVHVPLTLEALAAGKHVYVEKPLAETPEGCDRVVAAQRESGKHVAVGFNRRLSPAYTLAREILDAHGGARNLYYRISDTYWIWGARYTPRTRVIHEVCHIFDILRFLTGSEPVSVYAVESRPDDELFTLKFANGTVATIMSSGYLHCDMPKEYLEAVAEKGALTVTDFVELRTFGFPDREPLYRFPGHVHPDRDHVQRYLFAKEGAEALLNVRRVAYEAWLRLEELRRTGAQTPERAELENYQSRHAPHINYMVDKGWLQAIDHFAYCIASGETPRNANAYDGLRAAQVTAAAIKSRDTGQVVAIAG
ncbi:MAG: Gfo/Idh/MocA family oxidoreductase, partial [Armatimonadota bacterium]|nr:Gfo/Idh/MocA family oxidoreductase [Armatimonadota bacterium]